MTLLEQALEHVFGHYAVDAGDVALGGFSDALSLGALITHGTDDQVLPLASTSRRLVPQLEGAGYRVTYQELEGGHVVPGDHAAEARMWFLGTG